MEKAHAEAALKTDDADKPVAPLADGKTEEVTGGKSADRGDEEDDEEEDDGNEDDVDNSNSCTFDPAVSQSEDQLSPDEDEDSFDVVHGLEGGAPLTQEVRGVEHMQRQTASVRYCRICIQG